MADNYEKVDFKQDDLPDVAEILSEYKFKPFHFVHSIKNEKLNKLANRRIAHTLGRDESIGVALKKDGKFAAFSIFEYLPWDSKILEVECARIPYTVLSGDEPAQTRQAELLLKRILEIADEKKAVMINVRTSGQDLAFVHPLEDAGFRLMDNGMTALYHKTVDTQYEKKGLSLRFFQEGDLPYLLEILSGAYMDDRFHNDPRISNEKAEALYAAWLTNSCLNPGPGEKVLVCMSGDEIMGFYQYQPVTDFTEETGIMIYSAGLAAARRDRKGLGVYYHMLSKAKNTFVELGSEYGVSRIPFNITPILKMTLRLGPSFIANDLTFHLWLDDNA